MFGKMRMLASFAGAVAAMSGAFSGALPSRAAQDYHNASLQFGKRAKTKNRKVGSGYRDEEGLPYGVPGAKLARLAFAGRCTVKAGKYPVNMLHATGEKKK